MDERANKAESILLLINVDDSSAKESSIKITIC